MKPSISVVTIGVSDLEKAVEFYRVGLGLPTQGIIGKEFEFGAVAFFDLQSGLKSALWPRKSIAHDTGLLDEVISSLESTIGHNIVNKKEVDEVMEMAKKAGAEIVKPASETFWGGYAGYFKDLDGHLWEVVYNPALIPTD